MFSHIKVLNQISKSTFFLRKDISRFLHKAEHLKSRGILKVQGDNVPQFLQGMITNDINHLIEGKSSIYTMFLNVQGRVLFDSIIFKNKSEEFFIECDSSILQSLSHHLKLHKVKRKIFFEPSDMKVYAIFENDNEELKTDQHSSSTTSNSLDLLLKNMPENSIVFKDPRLQNLGYRLVLPKNTSVTENSTLAVCKNEYKILRYKLGIGEGIEEHQRGKCLPLEANCDYLHGVSFQKGCYIGQELTARTHHTGVVRKRFMPLILNKHVTLKATSDILNEKGKSVGKVISTSNGVGIGTMKIQDCLKAESLKIGDINVTTLKPEWWPIVAPKQQP